jgi:hypothetical protein
MFEKLLVLSGETTVMVEQLAEDKELIALLRNPSTSQQQALDYVNENY